DEGGCREPEIAVTAIARTVVAIAAMAAPIGVAAAPLETVAVVAMAEYAATPVAAADLDDVLRLMPGRRGDRHCDGRRGERHGKRHQRRAGGGNNLEHANLLARQSHRFPSSGNGQDRGTFRFSMRKGRKNVGERAGARTLD